MSRNELPPTVLCKDGDLEFPSIVSMYDFFSPRTKTAEIWCIGLYRGGVETKIMESTGAKVKIFDARPGSKGIYETMERILHTHESLPDDAEWVKELENHWVLPDSLSFSSTLPGMFSGTLDLSGVKTTVSAFDIEAVPRVDLCKIDYEDYTTDFLYSFLNVGYRPGLLFIRWPQHPDESGKTMTAAGHLQTCGYRLLKAAGNYFLYIFVDECMYELCSWARVDTNNPMFADFQLQLRGSGAAAAAAAAVPAELDKRIG